MKLLVAAVLLASLLALPVQEIDTIEVTASHDRDAIALILPFVILGGLLAGFVWQWKLKRARSATP